MERGNEEMIARFAALNAAATIVEVEDEVDCLIPVKTDASDSVRSVLGYVKQSVRPSSTTIFTAPRVEDTCSIALLMQSLRVSEWFSVMMDVLEPLVDTCDLHAEKQESEQYIASFNTAGTVLSLWMEASGEGDILRLEDTSDAASFFRDSSQTRWVVLWEYFASQLELPSYFSQLSEQVTYGENPDMRASLEKRARVYLGMATALVKVIRALLELMTRTPLHAEILPTLRPQIPKLLSLLGRWNPSLKEEIKNKEGNDDADAVSSCWQSTVLQIEATRAWRALTTLRCHFSPSISQALYVTQPIAYLRARLKGGDDGKAWKQEPSLPHMLTWCLRAWREQREPLGDLLGDLLPMILILVDDANDQTKSRGLRCLQLVVHTVSPADLARWSPVVLGALEQCLPFREEKVTLLLIPTAVDVLIMSLPSAILPDQQQREHTAVSTPSTASLDQLEQWPPAVESLLTKLFEEWSYLSQSLDTSALTNCQVFTSEVGCRMLVALGSRATGFLPRILPVLCTFCELATPSGDVLSGALLLADEKTVLVETKADLDTLLPRVLADSALSPAIRLCITALVSLGGIMQACWYRTRSHRGMLLECLLKSRAQVVDTASFTNKKLSTVRIVLKSLVDNLIALLFQICGRDSMQKYVSCLLKDEAVGESTRALLKDVVGQES